MKPPPLLVRGPLRTLGDLCLLTLTLLALSPLCCCQDNVVLEYCDIYFSSPQFNGDCNSAGVIRIKQAYIGYDCPPSDNRTICVGLTERLRVNCNRLTSCSTLADPLDVGCHRPQGSIVYIVYQCVPTAAEDLKSLTSSITQTASGQSVWLRSTWYPPEGDDIYRQACRITALPPQVIQVDFLDLSHSENRTSGSPYCVYGPGFSVCAEQASGRQTFDVDATSDATFTLLFWSNNYTVTTTARVWIDIRAATMALSPLTIVCGLTVLDYRSRIITPEPYDNKSPILDPTSHPGGQQTTEVIPQSPNAISIGSVIGAALGGFILGILSAVIFVFFRKRSEKRPNKGAHADPTETPAYENDDIARIETPANENDATGYETLGGDAVASHVYHDIQVPGRSPLSPAPAMTAAAVRSQVIEPTPTPSSDVGVLYQNSSNVAAIADGAYDKPRSNDILYDDAVTFPPKKVM